MSHASTILVVEDDAIVRMLIVDVLEELEFKVLEAADAEEALKMVKDTGQIIDLMMTDVGLPDMDGKQLATEVRELRATLPILFASSCWVIFDSRKAFNNRTLDATLSGIST